MDVVCRSGPASIVASGQITTFSGHPLELKLGIDAEFEYRIEWSFQHDEAVSDVDVRVEHSPESIRFLCINFDKADGRGTSKPVPILRHNDHTFFVHFRIFRFGKTEDRTIHYSIFKTNE